MTNDGEAVLAESYGTDGGLGGPETRRAVGTIGLVCAAGVAVILGIHPLGTTAEYSDATEFLTKVNWYWVIIHLLAVPLLFGFPLVLRSWSTTLTTPLARALGEWATIVAVLGMAVGAIHLIATDTITWFAFEDTFEAGQGSEATLVGADVLLRLHAATLTTWIAAFWLPVPALIAAALLLEPGPRPVWLRLLGPAAALSQVVAIAIFLNEREFTTAGETGFFRVGVTLLLVLLFALSFELRRGAPVGAPASSKELSTARA